jgi:hypothetical protein
MPKNIHQLTISADINSASVSVDTNNLSNNNESNKTITQGIETIKKIIYMKSLKIFYYLIKIQNH